VGVGQECGDGGATACHCQCLRLTEEVRQRYPRQLEIFSPLECSNMDMIDADVNLSQLATTYNLDEERLIAEWRLFRRTCGRAGGRIPCCDLTDSST